MGCDDTDLAVPGDGEGPVREVAVAPFALAAHTVTNAEFAEFAAATGHITEAERFASSFVFASFLPGPLRRISQRVVSTPWWAAVRGAYWAAPEGPGSSVEDRATHPVTHISHSDALAYCAWSGTRLPTEAEWEYAARGGLVQQTHPWGELRDPGGEYRCKIWRGRFPTQHEEPRERRGTAAVGSYPPNGFGLHEMTGNVWEWSADWWSVGNGPASAAERVMRGGSYLCHDSYCTRYRVSARTKNTPDSSAGNIGFRVAR
jgi:formylglycine-generating enzyme required for sulfatase activity